MSSTVSNRSSHRSAFSEPKYRRYFPASCFSTLSSWLIRFLFGWNTWELTHSAMWVGVVAGALLLPTIIFSPLFGIFSDRINPRNGLIVTLSIYSIVALFAGIAFNLGVLTPHWLVCLSIVLGIVISAHTPIRLVLIPLLVQRKALSSAIGYSSIIFNCSRIIGPAIGAWLVSAFSVAEAYFFAAFLCLVSVAFILGINGIPKQERKVKANFFLELKAGFRYATSHSAIRLIFIFVLVNSLLGRTLLELLPAFSGQKLNGSADTLATLSASAGVGAIIGGLFISRQGSDEKKIFRIIGASLVLSSICLLSIQWLNGLLQLSLLIFMASMIASIAGVGSQALTQLLVAEEFRGRVLSLWATLAVGFPAFGAIAIGALAETWGFDSITATIAVVTLVILSILAIINRKATKIDT